MVEKACHEEHDQMPPYMPSPMTLDPPSLQNADTPMSAWLHNWEPYVNMQTHTPMVTGSHPRSLTLEEEAEASCPHKHRLSGDTKDPDHPHHCEQAYQMEYHHWRTSKDRTNLEALEDNAPAIPRNAPLEDSSLDDATREDTTREDAPLATSYDLSLPLPDKAYTPMDDLP
jgi:hypothetical protein